MNALGVRSPVFDQPRPPYGEPVTLTILLITGIVAAVSAASKAGIDAASKAAAAKAAAFQSAGEHNPCVQRINAQIAQIPKSVIAITKTQRDNRDKRRGLEAQRDAYLANPNSCVDVVQAGTIVQQQAAIAQQTADTTSNMPYFVIAGLLVAGAGLAVTVTVWRRW